MRAYILVETQVGKTKGATEGVRVLNLPDVKVLSVETITGPYDIIAHVEFTDLDSLATAVAEGVQRVEGVQRTTTCLVISP